MRSTTSWCARRAGWTPRCCAASSRSRPPTLVPYDPGYLSGWTVERYQIDLVAAARAIARSRWTPSSQELCAAQVPGDTHRNLAGERRPTRDQTFKHILAPVWLLTYIYGATSYQVVVNGVTGTDRRQRVRGAGSRSRCS